MLCTFLNRIQTEKWKTIVSENFKTKKNPTFLDLQLMNPRPLQLSLIYHFFKYLILGKIIKESFIPLEFKIQARGGEEEGTWIWNLIEIFLEILWFFPSFYFFIWSEKFWVSNLSL